MLEDSAMDKKGNRPGSSQKIVADVKKLQESSSSKNFPKSAQSREPSLHKEQLRKSGNGTQKSRCDKKPLPRRFSHNSRAAQAQLEELEELGLVLTGKSKKRNVTHLLNFKCKPRDSEDFNVAYNSKAQVRVPLYPVRNLITTQKHKYNKEQYLQASCQFVVRADNDYSVQIADPDILVSWELVEQIRVLSPEGVSCPICLYPPVAGKITRCGHIYCWTCILHYLSLTDKTWQKCPICFESIHRQDLKSVTILERKQYSVGDEIVLRLMKREKGTTVAVPVEDNPGHPNGLLAVSDVSSTTVYSKLLVAGIQNIMDIISDEEMALVQQLVEFEHCPELCFVQQAMELLVERRNRILKEVKAVANKPEDVEVAPVDENWSFGQKHMVSSNFTPVNKSVTYLSAFDDMQQSTVPEVTDHESEYEHSDDGSTENAREGFESCGSNGEDTLTNVNVTAEDLELPTPASNILHKEYFFYQVSDGQQIFLHSINARMLSSMYKGLENAPLNITGKILEIESGSMTEELRKRLRYLEHLPVTCPFEVVEIELLPPVISEETYNGFKDQLDKRCRQRHKRAREEQKLEKKAHEYEKLHLGQRSPPRRLRLDSRHHFPECGLDISPGSSPRSRSLESSRASSPHSHGSSPPSLPPLASLSLNTSNTFAQKLKQSNPGGEWKKRSVLTVEDDAAGPSHSAPSTSCSLSEAVEAALLKATLEKQSGGSGQNKKKKKHKFRPLNDL